MKNKQKAMEKNLLKKGENEKRKDSTSYEQRSGGDCENREWYQRQELY